MNDANTGRRQVPGGDDALAITVPARRSERMEPEASSVLAYFNLLSDKCGTLFSRLAEVPEFGPIGPWQTTYFDAFQAYNALWKLQQEHRAALMEAGLSRRIVGDIASKIGQMYFQYYNRTSESRFLLESYYFYDAIRSRQYFESGADREDALLQDLRYYARFIVVCLLMQELTKVWQLLNEMHALVQKCSMTLEQNCQEWRLLLTEVQRCLEADTIVRQESPTKPAPVQMPMRLALPASDGPVHSIITDAIMVSYYHQQPKVAALPLDIIRMAQCLEWDPETAASPAQGSGGLAARAPKAPVPSSKHPANPRKVILFRCPMTRVHAALMTALDALALGKVLLLFVNADRPAPAPPTPDVCAPPPLEARASRLCNDGVLILPPPVHLRRRPAPPSSAAAHSAAVDAMNACSLHEPAGEQACSQGTPGSPAAAAQAGTREGRPAQQAVRALQSMSTMEGHAAYVPHAALPDQLLLPRDLVPLTRKRLLLVVDSDNAAVFEEVSRGALTYQPLLLLSPAQPAPGSPDQVASGKLFTLFLTNPLLALVRLCQLDPSPTLLAELQTALDAAVAAIEHGMPAWQQHADQDLADAGIAGWPGAWDSVLHDAFAKRLVVRFALCRTALKRMHSLEDTSLMLPRAVPELPTGLHVINDAVARAVDHVVGLLRSCTAD